MDEIRCDFRIKKSTDPVLQSLYDAREIAISLGLEKQRKLVDKKITQYKADKRNKELRVRRNEYRAF